MKKTLLLLSVGIILISLHTRAESSVPTITNISPTSGPVGTLVTISGTGLSNPSTLNIGGVSAIEISNNGSSLVARVTSGATTGTVYLLNSEGSANSPQTFTVTSYVPNTIMQIGADIDGQLPDDQLGSATSLSANGNRLATVSWGNQGQVLIYEELIGNWVKIGNNIVISDDGELAGISSVSLSSDGERVAIGATRIDGNSTDEGSVSIYEWNGSVWEKVGSDIFGEAAYDQSGHSVSLSADGQRVAISSQMNDGNGEDAGHVRIFDWNGEAWIQIGSDIDGEGSWDLSGTSVSLSSSGKTVAISSSWANSSTGHVRIFNWDGSNWMQVGSDINGEAEYDFSGTSISLSSNGEMVAIGSPGNNTDRGHVRIFNWDGSSWTQVGANIDGEAEWDQSGISVSLSANGQIVAIGALQNDGNGFDSGHVRLFNWNGSVWTQILSDIDGEASSDQSGQSVSLSADGQIIAIGAQKNDGNGNNAGHIRVFRLGMLPTISSFSGPVKSVKEDTEIEISLVDLLSNSDASDINGSVNAFRIDGIITGSLRIGSGADIATIYETGSNDTIDATSNAYWTPAANANGDSINAFEVLAVDNDGFESTTAVAVPVMVNAVNDLPTEISLNNNTLSENNIIGDLIGYLTTTDVDAADTHNYSFVAGTGDADNGSFTISGSDLQAAEVFDFETKSTYSIRIQTDDGNSGTLEEVFTININDVNDIPTGITLSDNSIDENNEIYDIVGSVATTDQDQVDTHTYSLVSGTGDTDNASFSINGEHLKAAEIFDFETKTDYSIRIQTDDGKGGTFQKEFAISINNLENETQTITFEALSNATFGDASFELTASTTSGLPISYTSSNEDVATISGGTVTIVGAGTTEITASQSGNEDYAEAESVMQSLTVAKAEQIVTFNMQETVSYGADAFELSAPASSELAVSFTSSDESVATINNGNLSIVGVGTVEISAIQAGNTNYLEAEEIRELTVNPAQLTVTADNKSSIYGEEFSEFTYSISGFVYEDDESVLGTAPIAATDANNLSDVGEYAINVSGGEAANYTFDYVSAILTIEKADQQITIESISDKVIDAPDFEVLASSTSGLELDYTLLSGPATIDGNLVSLTGETGTVEIEVSQAGNTNFNAAVTSISFEVIDPCLGFEANATVIQNVSCNGEANGSFEVNTSNGTAPFTFNIGNEDQENGLFENKAAGSYEISLTDANGCSATATVEITEPEAIEVTAETTDSNSILGNGSISLTVTGGTGSYSYDWSNGATTSSLTDLGIGEYSVIITDEAGCGLTESYTIGGVTATREAFEVNIFPNPVVNQVEIQHGDQVHEISLLNAEGKLIRQQSTTGKQSKLDMQALPAGMYFIRLDNGSLNRIIKK